MHKSRNQADIADLENQVISAIKHYDEGNIQEAEQICSRIMKLTSRHPKVLNLLGIIYSQTGRQETGFSYLQRAVSLQPDFVGAQFNLAKVLRLRGQHNEAIIAFKKTLALKPDHVMALNDLGNVYKEMDQLSESICCFRQILNIQPDFMDAHNNMGIVLLLQGELDEAEVHFRRALELSKNGAINHSNLLLCLQYNPAISDIQLFADHLKWDEMHGKTQKDIYSTWQNPSVIDRPIKIGYISADFRRHPIGYFLASVFASHDKQQVKICCYSNSKVEDDLTDELRKNADIWRTVYSISDKELAEIIRADYVDILVDLSGHTGKNRLSLFAMKPAPIQVTWAGYVGTTGLSSMDYLISDGRQSPLGAETFCTESIVRLPDCYVCYAPPDYAPEVASLPALQNNYVTFGSFNNLSKITPQVVELWSDLLKKIPNSRLLLRTKALGDQGVAGRYKDLFTANGIGPERVSLMKALPHKELLSGYNNVDIALDPFPYSGGLTTLESLWMGVPVITLGGDRFCSRHSITHLTTVGLGNLIASNRDDYLGIAERLALDIEILSVLRSTLRNKVMDSPLCDAPRFTRNLESAFRSMWHRWCEEQASLQIDNNYHC